MPLRITVSYRVSVSGEQFRVEIIASGAADRRTVEHRRLPGGRKRLLFEFRQREVTVVASQVRHACRRYPAWLGRRVALMNRRDDHWLAVGNPVFNGEPDRRTAGTRLAREPLLDDLRISSATRSAVIISFASTGAAQM